MPNVFREGAQKDFNIARVATIKVFTHSLEIDLF